MSRTSWGYHNQEMRLYQFPDVYTKRVWVEELAFHEEISAQDSFVADFRGYAVKWGKEEAIVEYISPNSPLQGE